MSEPLCKPCEQKGVKRKAHRLSIPPMCNDCYTESQGAPRPTNVVHERLAALRKKRRSELLNSATETEEKPMGGAYKLPETWEALEAAGYVFQRRTTCKACGATVEWWLTVAGRWMPIEVVALAGGARMAHWGICPKADTFRRKQSCKQQEPPSQQNSKPSRSGSSKKAKPTRGNTSQRTLFRI